MNLSIEELQAEVAATGFPIETLDRVIRLIDLQNRFEATHLSRTRSSLHRPLHANLTTVNEA